MSESPGPRGPSSAAELRARFAQTGPVTFEEGAGGLVRAAISTARGEAHVYLQGAHVTHFQRRGEGALLFLSARSQFADGRAIRGGVPVVFPWFGPKPDDPAAPQHGFARTAMWQVESAGATSGGEAFVELGLAASAATLAIWPGHFRLRYRVQVGAALELTLAVANEGAAAFTFEEALHTYLAVSDVASVTLGGLEGVAFIDKVDGMARRQQGPEHLQLAGETDRVFLDTEAASAVDDPGAGRRIEVTKAGSRSTVVWNPWADKAAAMPDLGPEAWRRMLCVEAGNVADNRQRLAPGERHELRVTLAAALLPGAAPRP
jgi:glucose-6-phosphate 1-epimerase